MTCGLLYFQGYPCTLVVALTMQQCQLCGIGRSVACHCDARECFSHPTHLYRSWQVGPLLVRRLAGRLLSTQVTQVLISQGLYVTTSSGA
jgi:hypothetical protein